MGMRDDSKDLPKIVLMENKLRKFGLEGKGLSKRQKSRRWWGPTPRKINMEHENTPLDKGKSSSKPSFSGSMLIFQGVSFA